jgi:hypothetical protein
MSIKNTDLTKQVFDYLNNIVQGELVKAIDGIVDIGNSDIMMESGKHIYFASTDNYIIHTNLLAFNMVCGDEDMNITMNANSIADTRTMTLSALNNGFGDGNMVFNAKSNISFKINDTYKIQCNNTSFEFFNDMNAGTPNTFSIGIHGNNWLRAYILTVNTNNISSIDTSALSILGAYGLNLNSTDSIVNIGTTGTQTINIGNPTSTVNIYGSFVFNPNTNMIPALDNTYDFGSNIKHWKNGYINNIYFATLTGESITGVDLSLSGTTSFDIESNGIIEIGADNVNKDIYIGTSGTRNIYLASATGSVTINGSLIYDFKANIIPETTNTYDLGSSSYYWNNGYITNIYNANLQTQNISSTIFALTATDSISLNSSGGKIFIGNNSNNHDIDVGTGGVRTITLGNSGCQVYIPGYLNYIRKASIICNADDTYDIGDAVNQWKYLYVHGAQISTITSSSSFALTANTTLGLESDNGTINLGANNVDQNINIGTSGSRTIIIGNSNATVRLVGDVISDYMNVVPITNNTYNLGSSSDNKFWNYGYITNVNTTNITNITGSRLYLTSDGGITITSSASTINIGTDTGANDINIGTAGNKNINIGNTNSVTTIYGLNVMLGSIVPNVTNTYDIGSGSFYWLNGYFTNLYLTNINGSTIDFQTTSNITIDSSGGSISIGNDDNIGDINIGTNGTRNINIGNVNANTVIYGTNLMAGDIIANVTNMYNLGSTLLRWKTSYITDMYTVNLHNCSTSVLTIDGVAGVLIESDSSTISIGSNAVNQNINIGTGGVRTVNIGNSNSIIYLNGTITQNFSNVVPTTSNTYSLGSVTKYWLSGYITDLHMTNIYNISGSTLDIQSTNGIYIDTTSGTLNIGDENDDIDINIGTNGTRTITIGNINTNTIINGDNIMGGGIIPSDSNTFDIGTSSKYWRNNYLTSIYTSNIYNVGTGNLTMSVSNGISIDSVSSTITIGGNNNTSAINIGSAGTRNINIGNSTSTLNIFGSFITSTTLYPVTTLLYDLGTTTKYWNNCYLTNIYCTNVYGVNLNLLATGTLDIESNGSTINIGTNDTNQIVNFVTGGTCTLNIGNTNTTIVINGTTDILANLLPNATNTYNLGSATRYWNNGYITTINATNVDGTSMNIGTTGTGTITLGKSSRTLSLLSAVSSTANITPSITNTYDLGSSSYYWNNGYITTLQTANINGSAVVIATTGNFSINSSGGTISVGTDNVDQNINIATAGTRTLTIGTTSTTIILNGTMSYNTNLIPATTNTYNIGSGAKYWSNGYITTLYNTTINTSNIDGATITILGTGNVSCDSTGGTISIGSGSNDYAINIGTSGIRTITIGSVTGTTIMKGTTNIYSNLTPNATGTYDIGSATKYWNNLYISKIYSGDISGTEINVLTSGNVSMNSSGGTVNIGTNDTTGDINIGTAGSRNINIGNANANTIIYGTNLMAGDIIANVTDTYKIGSAVLYWKEGYITTQYSTTLNVTNINGSAVDFQTTGNITIDSSGGTIGIGTDNVNKNINIATAGTRSLTLGTTTTTVIVNGITDILTNLLPDVTNTYNLGSGSYYWNNGYITTLNTTNINGSAVDLQTTGNITIDSSGGTISIGSDANNQNINIGTSGTRTITFGSASSNVNFASSIGSNVISTVTNTYDLGSSSYYWNNSYITTMYTPKISGTTLEITGTTLNMTSTTAINVGDLASTTTINIGTTGAKTINIGNAGATVNISGFSFAVLDLVPELDNTYSLGSVAKKWKNEYVNNVYCDTFNSNSGTVNFCTDPSVTEITIGSATTNVNIPGFSYITGNIVPDADGTRDLGSATRYWANSYDNNISTLTIRGKSTSLDIDNQNGTIDIGTNNYNNNINIGTTGTRTITIGSASATVTIVGLSIAYTNLNPDLTDTRVIGTSLLIWKESYINTMYTNVIQPKSGVTLDIYSTSTAINLGTDVNNNAINIGTAGAKTITIGNTGGSIVTKINILPNANNTLNLGSGSYYWNNGYITTLNTGTISASTLAISGTSTITMESSGGTISIGSNANNYNINIATAGTRILTLGTATTTISINGTTDILTSLLPNATSTYNLGSATYYWNNGYINTINTGTISGTTLIVAMSGAITVNSTGGTISIGNDNNDQNMNIATGGTRTLTIGKNTTTIVLTGTTDILASLLPDATNTYNLGSGAKYWNDGYITTLNSTTINTGTVSGTTLSLSATSNVTIESSGGTINIGSNADSQNINIGTLGTRTITVGNTNATVILDGTVQHNSSIIPNTTNTYDFGSSSKYWNNGYITTLNTSTISAATLSLSTTSTIDIESSGNTISIGNNAIDQNINIATGGTRTLTLGTTTTTIVFNGTTDILTNLIPNTTGTYNLGSGTKYWNNGYVNTIYSTTVNTGTVSGSTLAISGTNNVTIESSGGTLTMGGNNINQNINIGTAGTRTITLGSGSATLAFNGTVNYGANIIPSTTNTYDLGSATKYWNNGYITTVYTGTISGTSLSVNMSGAITVESSGGTITIGGNVINQNVNIATGGTRTLTLGTATTTIVVNGTMDYNVSLIPHTTNTYDVGSATKYWNNGYITTLNSSTGNITTFNATNINGSAVDFSTTGNITINSSGGTINIGSTANNQNINLGTAGTRTITIGNSNTATIFAGTLEANSSFIPNTTNTYDLGSASKYWNNGYITTLGTSTIFGTTLSVSTTNTITIDSTGGNINIGNGANNYNINVATNGTRTLTLGTTTTTINVNGTLNYYTNLIPNTTNTYDLGSASKYWNNGYITTINTTSVTGTNVTIDGTGTFGIGTVGSGVITFGKSGRTLNVESIINSNANIVARTNNMYDLGTLIDYWNNGYITTLNTSTISGTTLSLTATSTISINSSGGVINVGTDNVSQNINVATNGTRTLTIGTTTTTINMNGTLNYYTSLIPATTNTYDLGSSSKYWNNGYITTINTASVTGTNVTIDGSGTLGIGNVGTGTITLGKASRVMNVESSININDNIIPRITTSFDLGTSSYIWNRGYINTVYSNAISGSTITISGTSTITVDSTGGTINIGNGTNNYDVNIATAGTRNVSIGTSTSTLIFGGVIHSDLTPDGSHIHNLGSNTAYWSNGYISTVNSSAVTSTAGLAISTVGNISLESSAGTIGFGNNNVNQNINIGTNGIRTITIGNTNATVVINGGFTISSFSNVIPSLNNTYDLGSTILYWNHGYITNLEAVNINGTNVSMATTGTIGINSTGGAISIGSGSNNYNINIGTGGTRTITIGSKNATLVFNATTSISFSNSLLPSATDTYNLGSASLRWNNAYIKNISYVTLTSLSDRREKQDVCESNLGLDFIMNLIPVKYKFKPEYNDEKVHYGFIAQDLEKTIQDMSLEINEKLSIVSESDNKKMYQPMELLAPMVKAIQELAKIVKEIKENMK